MSEFQQILQEIMSGNKAPSVQYMLFDKDRIINKYSAGYADILRKKIVNDKTTYHAFSITKTFTALAILQLAEKNTIDIEKPIIDYFPKFPYQPAITIRQLLTHTSGIPNPIPISWIHPVNEHNSFDRNKFFNNVFSKYPKLKFQPGQNFMYSNLGYVVLGELIEEITKTSYEAYINENIIQRLELSAHDLGFEIADAESHAKGYHKKWSITNLVLGLFMEKAKYMGSPEGKWKPFNPFLVNGVSYGGLFGTTSAFVRYIQELLKTNCSLLSDKYKMMMFTENHTNNGKATGMCLSWFSGQLNGVKFLAHAGGGGGYYCETRLYPEMGIGSVVFFNRTGMSDERLLDRLDKFYFTN